MAKCLWQEEWDTGETGCRAHYHVPTDLQRPQRISLLQSLKQCGHIKCLLLTILVVSCAAVVFWCRVAKVSRLVVNFHNFPVSSREKTSPCDDGYIYIPFAFMVMLYLVYLVECWHSSTRLELTYKVDVEDVYQYIEQMREAQPIIWWKAISYHYIRRSRQVTRYRNGDAYTTSQTYYERINSRASSSCFVYNYSDAKDISKKIVDLEKNPVTKIRFSKGFAFASLDVASDFEEQRMRFFRENESFDDYMEMREGLDLLGVDFQEYIVTCASKDYLPWYASHAMFWIFSLLLMSWPLRVVIDSKTAYVQYQVTKLFGASSFLLSTVQDHPISRNSTIDSIEMERDIANRLNLAPSYSEAALIGTGANVSRSVESGLHMETQIRSSSNLRISRNLSVCRSNDRENGPAGRRGIPKSISQPFKTFQDLRRLNINRRYLLSRWSRESPPSYEDAMLFSEPLLSYMTMRRSATDRDLSGFRPLRASFRSFSSLFHWTKRSLETAL
ncbi:transmembrane protein 151B-like [Stegodyphus dumicola]|uniref:transmembrane protein 151B-like n=1 Tax=Stegodyphus dumicola TaxID=202533 RepID=UPI0015A8BA5E|nr:transmembrane protein 151B-like [Stegodyphus dumicola]